MTINIAEITELSVAERIQLVQDIWDSLWSVPESIELTDTQVQELERRLENYRHQPESSVPWEEVKNRIKNPQ